jgi:hypothetical protein
MKRKIERAGAVFIILLMIATAAIKYDGWEFVAGVFIAICIGTALLGFGGVQSE